MAELNLPCFAKPKRALGLVCLFCFPWEILMKMSEIPLLLCKRVLSPSLGVQKQLIYYYVLTLFLQCGIDPILGCKRFLVAVGCSHWLLGSVSTTHVTEPC